MDRPRNMGPAKATWSLVVSLVAHVGAITVAGWIAYQLTRRDPHELDSKTAVQDETIAIELPSVAEGALVEAVRRELGSPEPGLALLQRFAASEIRVRPRHGHNGVTNR